VTQQQEPHGLDLFDDNASAVRGFPNAMLGYDKKAVDDYIRDVERQLTLARHQLREVQRELTAVQSPRRRHGLQQAGGAHTANLLEGRRGPGLGSHGARSFSLGRADRAGEGGSGSDARRGLGDRRGGSSGGHRLAARVA
jgi:hypothetical protein